MTVESRLRGAVDIGSNTIRMLIGEYSPARGLVIHDSRRHVTRLGKQMENGFLLPEAIQRSVEVLAEYKRCFDDFALPSQHLNIIATSAVRSASNRLEFIETVQQDTGLEVRVVDGAEEARLAALGVCAAVKAAGNKLIVDIGGGSVEFILVDRDTNLLHSRSVEMGVVRLTEKFITRAPLSIEEYLNMQEFVLEKLDTVHEEFARFDLTHLKIVGTAGTYTTAAHVLSGQQEYSPRLINGMTCTVKDTKMFLDKLSDMTLAQRLEAFPIEKGREDLIIAGLCLALNINSCFCQDHFMVSDYGLREGALIDAASR
ncbi:Ppx/GppA phosphatase [Desulfurispirillum indicum S5]|uniref:Ppx/GppA phosphatase n=1 Tax=Desulfurispirillum indicum (strain ATCC BAA-1389 / DSM 22839 / S5) TaxID=653733 RepID=E6W184_DESIS|nr:Ppx/GppA phosphatase [Desulfurispirillum indicum]ADU66504.1 Ppx/GppA phosphatase [Desulfurispirillum indicum S5]